MDVDVVVVGGGSAGCVLAARLSEDRSRTVLLLEAGPDYDRRADLPPEIADGSYPTGSHDWGFRSEPDDRGRTLDLLRGRLIGGCSSTNACMALRGSPGDYDGWAASGNRGWSFDEVLPAFRRCETDLDFPDAGWHGSTGPLPIRRDPPDLMSPVGAAALDAAVRLGHPWVEDHNRPRAVGAGPIPANRIDGLRMSTALTFLEAARGRSNLTIRSNALVDRVLIDADRAVGVTVAGVDRPIRCGAVVIAAGAYQSPAILLRSGIGPADRLASSGVRTLIDLPGVGSNLIEHAWVSVDIPASPDPPAAPLGQVVVTLRSASANDDDPAGPPDLQLLPCSAIRVPEADSPTGALFFVGVSVLKPRSRGRVWLRSPDPADAPRIDPAHFRDRHDMARTIEGVVAARALLRTDPLSELVAGPEMRPSPGIADGDTAGLEAGIRATFGTYHHPVGTCRMGPDPGGGAVVDARGRVHGVEGLWVADASVMPDIPSANTNLPTIMVAERIAGWLREDA